MAETKKVIAFDFDGTIIDTAQESFLTSAKTYYEMTGIGLVTEKNAKHYIQGRGFSLNAEANYTLIKLIADNPLIDFSIYTQVQFDKEAAQNKSAAQEFAKKFGENRKKFAETKEWFDCQKPFWGVKELIGELSKNYVVYITTTKKKWSVEALLNYYNFNFPEEKIISDHSKETKEDLLRLVAEKEGILISEIILIDDAIKQVLVAKKAGAKVILAMWGEKRKVFEDEAKKELIPIAYLPKDCERIIGAIVK
ncbi:MAG: HAD hydrolase-like protein [archaeon]|jgi:phosphoglycolate phosphatase-like HAD superfamily hydrolase